MQTGPSSRSTNSTMTRLAVGGTVIFADKMTPSPSRLTKPTQGEIEAGSSRMAVSPTALDAPGEHPPATEKVPLVVATVRALHRPAVKLRLVLENRERAVKGSVLVNERH